MAQTRRQSSLPGASPLAGALQPSARRSSDESLSRAQVVAMPPVPPEIFLMVMKTLAGSKLLGTLLEFALANKEFAALALPVLKSYPRCTIWLAMSCHQVEMFQEFFTDVELGEHVYLAATTRERTQAYLARENEMTSFALAGRKEPDFFTKPLIVDDWEGSEPPIEYFIRQYMVYGALELKTVWLRFKVSEYWLGNATVQLLDGVFGSEDEAREKIKELGPEAEFTGDWSDEDFLRALLDAENECEDCGFDGCLCGDEEEAFKYMIVKREVAA